MNEPLLSARGIQKVYRMGRTSLRVLSGCDLHVNAGEFVAIMGKSGSGKSTLLHILGALDDADGGEVFYAGEPVQMPNAAFVRFARRADAALALVQRILIILLFCWLPVAFIVFILFPLVASVFQRFVQLVPGLIGFHLVVSSYTVAVLAGLGLPLVIALFVRLFVMQFAERRRTSLRRHTFGFVFQFYHLLPELNVRENVLLARKVGRGTFAWLASGYWRAAARADTADVLQRVGLTERAKHRPNELSGGERQRVAIARALVHKPRILFADEPTGNLDAEAGASLMSLLKGLHSEGQTLVMVTHDPGIAAQADRTVILENGRLRPA